MSLSFKFRKDPCIRWGDIQLLVTMYISYHTLNFSQFSPENFDFFGTPSYWYFLISSVQWQFLTRRKKPHAISINTERVRSPRVQTFWWHSSNRDVRPGEFQPYVVVQTSFRVQLEFKLNKIRYFPNPHRCLFLKNLRHFLSDLNNLGQFSTAKTMRISPIAKLSSSPVQVQSSWNWD